MPDIIIIAGAPGTGKTTVSEMLRQKLDSPLIDFGDLRIWHLDKNWSNQSAEEEQMAFENLVFILKNYIKRDYRNIIVTDLKDERVNLLSRSLSPLEVIIFTLTVRDDKELKKRVLGERDSGFKNVEGAQVWNKKIIERESFINEYKIDNTHSDPKKTVNQIMALLNQKSAGAEQRRT